MSGEAKMLSECGGKYFPDPTDPKYWVEIEPGDYLFVEMGFVVGKAGARFKHPNIAKTVRRVYGFKHYLRSGAKRWTHAPGVSHYFIIPKSAIKLLPEKGYSYIPAEINGIKIVFNVSGGGGGDWTDYLRTQTQISVNHPKAALKKIAEVALPPGSCPFEIPEIKPTEGTEDYDWKVMVARKMVRPKIIKLVKEGKTPTVYLRAGCDYMGETNGKADEIHSWKHDVLVLSMGGYRVNAKGSQIDWYRTACANGMDEWGKAA